MFKGGFKISPHLFSGGKKHHNNPLLWEKTLFVGAPPPSIYFFRPHKEGPTIFKTRRALPFFSKGGPTLLVRVYQHTHINTFLPGALPNTLRPSHIKHPLKKKRKRLVVYNLFYSIKTPPTPFFFGGRSLSPLPPQLNRKRDPSFFLSYLYITNKPPPHIILRSAQTSTHPHPSQATRVFFITPQSPHTS